jgi:hypothetical protein
VLAYQFLLRQGFNTVEILQEDGTRKPDIAYRDCNNRRYCEVKSIGISDDEIRRFSAEDVFDAAVYKDLSGGFRKKLGSDLKQAQQQISSQGGRGLVFLDARFDDLPWTITSAIDNSFRSF